MTRYFDLLPDELILKIGSYASPMTKQVLLSVDKRISEIIRDLIRSIRIYPPQVYDKADTPNDILFRVINRNRKTNKIIFGQLKHYFFRKINEFTIKEETYIQTLISIIENNREKFALIKKIEFNEIKNDLNDYRNINRIKQLNHDFLQTLSKLNLTKLRIRFLNENSVFSENEIQDFLNISLNLKSLTLDSLNKDRIINLSFARQTSLIKIKFLNTYPSNPTIASLKNCSLQDFVIQNDFSNLHSRQILSESSLLRENEWNLKHLDISHNFINDPCELTNFIKKYPNLKYLRINLYEIDSSKLIILARNCLRLKTLYIKNDTLRNLDLEIMSSFLKHLEVIVIQPAYKITQKGIQAIAKNCKNLKSLQIHRFKKVNLLGFQALIENCKNLQVLSLTHGTISIEGLYELAKNMKYLSYVDLLNLNMTQKEIDKFYMDFPPIKKSIQYTNIKTINKYLKSYK